MAENEKNHEAEQDVAKTASVLGGSKKASTGGKIAFDSMEDLMSLITNVVKTAITESNNKVAEAIIESRKPYVDPRQLENEKAMRDSMRKVNERIQRQIEADQESCGHFQGSNALSDFQGQLSSIVQHRLDTGEVIGICTNCLRVFRPGDPDYLKEMRRKSGNRMSSSGQRMFLDPRAAVEAGRG